MAVMKPMECICGYDIDPKCKMHGVKARMLKRSRMRNNVRDASATPKKPGPKIKAGAPTRVPTPSKPHCPVHQQEMLFNLDRQLWSCEVPHCGMVSFPKQELDSGKPIVGTGDMELLVVRDEFGEHRVFVKATATNIMVEVTNYLVDANISGPQRGLGHGNKYDVSLIFEKGSMIDHHGRPLET